METLIRHDVCLRPTKRTLAYIWVNIMAENGTAGSELKDVTAAGKVCYCFREGDIRDIAKHMVHLMTM